MSIPQAKQMRRAYGFDEVAIVPGEVTINPAMTEIALRIDHLELPLPFLAAAMDGVVDPGLAIKFSEAGGLAVLNLEGVQTRYDDPSEVLAEVAAASKDDATTILQRAYAQPARVLRTEILVDDDDREMEFHLAAKAARGFRCFEPRSSGTPPSGPAASRRS